MFVDHVGISQKCDSRLLALIASKAFGRSLMARRIQFAASREPTQDLDESWDQQMS